MMKDKSPVNIVVPVYNEAEELASSVERLDDFLADSFPYDYRITIADNASVDETPRIAKELADDFIVMDRGQVVMQGDRASMDEKDVRARISV